MGDSDPHATFGYVARELGKRGIAFICAREALGDDRLGPLLKKEFGGVYIANEKMTRESAEQLITAGEADAVAWGQWFIANPDLPARLKLGAPLNAPRADKFYAPTAEGYTDYPALEQQAA
jgi:2,4-dienoyl-CoA reductase-like NADH-dependent reductase (Old Yellow Enzyme family)